MPVTIYGCLKRFDHETCWHSYSQFRSPIIYYSHRKRRLINKSKRYPCCHQISLEKIKGIAVTINWPCFTEKIGISKKSSSIFLRQANMWNVTIKVTSLSTLIFYKSLIIDMHVPDVPLKLKPKPIPYYYSTPPSVFRHSSCY